MRTGCEYLSAFRIPEVAQIQKLIKQRVDALVIAAIDNQSLEGVLQQAAEAKIPVISYDRLILATKNADYYASVANEPVARLQSRCTVDKLRMNDGKGPFAIELFAGSAD